MDCLQYIPHFQVLLFQDCRFFENKKERALLLFFHVHGYKMCASSIDEAEVLVFYFAAHACFHLSRDTRDIALKAFLNKIEHQDTNKCLGYDVDRYSHSVLKEFL